MNKTKDSIIENKIFSSEYIGELVREFEEIPSYMGKSAVLGGCFDILHAGHLDMISRAYGYEFEDGTYIDTLIIALNSDISVKILKGPTRPIINQDDRAFNLASLQYVHYVTIFDEPVIDNVLKTIKPNYFIKSDQYSYDIMTDTEKQIFKDYNIKPLFLPFHDNHSTTNIINTIKEK